MQIYDKLELENVLASECLVKHIEHITHTLMRGSRVRYIYITHLEESTKTVDMNIMSNISHAK